MDYYSQYYNLICECEDILDEGYRKKVIRKGKLKKKLFCPKGQKAKGNKCVPMKSTEKSRRKIKAKKAAVKRKGKMSRIKKKRKKAMKKRKTFSLK